MGARKTLPVPANNIMYTIPLFIALTVTLAFPLAAIGDTAESVTWQAYLAELRSKNSSLKAQTASVEAAKSDVALFVPSTFVGFGSMGERSPVSGVMERSFEITQKIPFPTKFAKASQVKSLRIDYAESMEAVANQEIYSEAIKSFIGLDENLKTQKILVQYRDLLTSHVRRLNSLTISDSLQKVHILTVDADSMVVKADLEELKQEEIGLRQRLSEYLLSEGVFSGSPSLKAISNSSAASLKNFSAKLATVEAAKKSEALSGAEATYAKQIWLPDFSFTYRKRNRFDGVMPSNHEFMIGLEIPFFWNGQNSVTTSGSTLRAEKARFESATERRRADAEIATLQAELESGLRKINIFREEVLPLQEKSMSLLHRLSPSDMETLDLHRVTFEKWLSDQVKLIKLEGNFRRALARLQILAGDSQNLELL